LNSEKIQPGVNYFKKLIADRPNFSTAVANLSLSRKCDQGQSGQATVLMQHNTDPGRYVFLAIQFMVVSRRFHEPL
jgi:hypothetical protein